MAIDIRSEKPLSLKEAAKSLPPIDGKRPHISTIWRWCRKGVRGVTLEYVRVGNRVCTSSGALARFVNKLAAADPPLEHSAPATDTIHSAKKDYFEPSDECDENMLAKMGM